MPHFFDNSSYLTSTIMTAGDTAVSQGTVSFWIQRETVGGAQRIAFIGTTADGYVSILYDASNQLNILVAQKGGSLRWVHVSATATTADSTWHHVVASWDLTDTDKRHVIQDGTDVTVSSTNLTSTTHRTDRTTFAIGATAAGANLLRAYVHDFNYWPTYIDVSDVDFLRFFLSSDGQGGFTPSTSTLYAPDILPSGRKPVGYGHQGEAAGQGVRAQIMLSGGLTVNHGVGGGVITVNGTPGNAAPTVSASDQTLNLRDVTMYRLASRPGEMAPERWFDSEKSGMSAKRSETFIEKRAGHPDIGKRLRQKDEDDAETRDLTSLRQQWSSLIRPNEEDSLERLPGE